MARKKQVDYLIIGAGIIGLAVARAIRDRFPDRSIVMLEKESDVAEHGSGRNSGVLHAGFYYSADSLKARFCREGCADWKAYVRAHGLKINPCQKLVVAKNEIERQGIHELKRRGDLNRVEVHVVDAQEMAGLDPNARTYGQALYSPTTATVDPVQISRHLANQLREEGVEILLQHPYRAYLGDGQVLAGALQIQAGQIINCAGLYADHIARDFGFCRDYTIIPFKGIHLLAQRAPVPSVQRLIYPVPNLHNPFLGVHFNLTVDGKVKIGPTAIPAFWRENYQGLARFNPLELAHILGWEALLFTTNAFGFRRLAIEEIRKYRRRHLLDLVRPMVHELDEAAFTSWARPGIRAQLLHKQRRELLHDFVVEGDTQSVHVLNAVSPAFTSSLPFGRYIVEKYIEK